MTDSRIALLAETDVLDTDGQRRKLGEFFASKPTALLFVRHFG